MQSAGTSCAEPPVSREASPLSSVPHLSAERLNETTYVGPRTRLMTDTKIHTHLESACTLRVAVARTEILFVPSSSYRAGCGCTFHVHVASVSASRASIQRGNPRRALC
jgi:hypothetical protein